jgi:hypothetical protein
VGSRQKEETTIIKKCLDITRKRTKMVNRGKYIFVDINK